MSTSSALVGFGCSLLCIFWKPERFYRRHFISFVTSRVCQSQIFSLFMTASVASWDGRQTGKAYWSLLARPKGAFISARTVRWRGAKPYTECCRFTAGGRRIWKIRKGYRNPCWAGGRSVSTLCLLPELVNVKPYQDKSIHYVGAICWNWLHDHAHEDGVLPQFEQWDCLLPQQDKPWWYPWPALCTSTAPWQSHEKSYSTLELDTLCR